MRRGVCQTARSSTRTVAKCETTSNQELAKTGNPPDDALLVKTYATHERRVDPTLFPISSVEQTVGISRR